MTIDLLVLGKTESGAFQSLIDVFGKRIRQYAKFNIREVVSKKKAANPDAIKLAEAELLKPLIKDYSHVVLLDEKGKQRSSVEFARWIEEQQNRSVKSICFVVGGAYGFDDSIKALSHSKISLSSMTFNHQLVRVVFVEQLYRAFSILHGHPYHNE